MLKGKFIVIDGTDGSGKATQLEILRQRLAKEGHQVETIDFPRYVESPFGKVVGMFLNGDFGGLKSINPYLVVLPYMLDQYVASRDEIDKWLNEGKIVLANRYVTTNFAHQTAKFRQTVDKKKYKEWLQNAAFDYLKMIEPNMVIILGVDPLIARKLIKKKETRIYTKKKHDIAEKDLNYQIATYKEYQGMCKERGNWQFIKCTSDSKIKEKEVIAEQVYQQIADLLK